MPLSAGINDATVQRAVRALENSVGNNDDATQRSLTSLQSSLTALSSVSGGTVTTPAVPATNVVLTNTTGKNVTAYIKGGTLTAILVNGIATGVSAAAPAGSVHSIRLSAGQTIKLTYTVAPTWVWIGN